MKNDKIRQWLRKQWREWRVALFLIVFVVVPVKSSVADFNWVPSGSMKPTILEGDFVFVNKAAYDLRVPLTLHRVARWADPRRGDIVICFSPDDGVRLIKRVVGLPGDTLEMRNNRLIINGQFAQQSAMPPEEAEALATLFHGKRLFAGSSSVKSITQSWAIRRCWPRGASHRSPFPSISISSWATTATTAAIPASSVLSIGARSSARPWAWPARSRSTTSSSPASNGSSRNCSKLPAVESVLKERGASAIRFRSGSPSYGGTVRGRNPSRCPHPNTESNSSAP